MSTGVFRLLRDGDPEHGMEASINTSADSLTDGDVKELNHVFHTSPDGKTYSGVWECTPCREEFDAYPVDEMMTVLSGSVTLTDSNGKAETFTSGDTFYIAKGTKCIWQIDETLRKYYMITE